MKGIFLLRSDAYQNIYGPAEQEEIARLVAIYASPQTAKSVAGNPAILHEAEIILSGWGMAAMDQSFLAAAPNLKAVFYGAGSIRKIVSDAFWKSGIVIMSAYAALAIPVAEYTLSQILFCLKRGWYFALTVKQQGRYIPRDPVPGAYGSTVGIISLGMIGRRVCQLLQPFDLRILAYDPYVTEKDATALNVELCSLEDLFRRSDVVSLHTPWLPETVGMIRGAHFASMKQDASFINTARGAVVREQEMIDVLRQRPDLYAVMDVTYPEPPVPGSALYTLPNVVLTPHIAGTRNRECRRLGQAVIEDLKRFLQGKPLKWAISQEQAKILA